MVTTKQQAFKYELKQLHSLGNLCEIAGCSKWAVAYITFRKVSSFGGTYGCARRVCSEHAKRPTAAKLAA